MSKSFRNLLSDYSVQELQQYLRNVIDGTEKDALSPADALRLLFKIDADFYILKGQLSIMYDNGTHTKHRHIGYHKFFIDRIHKNDTVFDIGCGKGELAFDIAQKTGAHVTAIDIIADLINYAQKTYPHEHVRYLTGNALSDLPRNPSNIVILSNVLEHIKDRIFLLKEIQQKLCPQLILLRVPLFERDWQVPLKKELGIEWRLDPTHETEYTQESFTEEIKTANLKVLHLEIRWGEIWAELAPA